MDGKLAGIFGVGIEVDQEAIAPVDRFKEINFRVGDGERKGLILDEGLPVDACLRKTSFVGFVTDVEQLGKIHHPSGICIR